MKQELWLIWKDPIKRVRYKVGVLNYYNDNYIFEYINPELDEAMKAGFKYYPGFENLTEKYVSKELFANVFTRIPNSKRPDYLSILNSYNLNLNSSVMDILRETRGRLITDNFEFVPCFDKNKIEFDVAGTRYVDDLNFLSDKLFVNTNLFLEVEENNKYDKDAVKILFEYEGKNYFLGYVPKYYSKYIKEILNDKVLYSAMINSLNFESDIFDENITVKVKLIFEY